MKRYFYGWWMAAWAFRKARRKKHGAGKMPFGNALRMGAAMRFLIDGQHYQPMRPPFYLRTLQTAQETL